MRKIVILILSLAILCGADERLYRWDPQMSEQMRETIRQWSVQHNRHNLYKLSAENPLTARLIKPCKKLELLQKSCGQISDAEFNSTALMKASFGKYWAPLLKDLPADPLVSITMGRFEDTVRLVPAVNTIQTLPPISTYYSVQNPSDDALVTDSSVVGISMLFLIKKSDFDQWDSCCGKNTRFTLSRSERDIPNHPFYLFNSVSLTIDTIRCASDSLYSEQMSHFCRLLSMSLVVKESFLETVVQSDSLLTNLPRDFVRWLRPGYIPPFVPVPIDPTLTEKEQMKQKILNQISEQKHRSEWDPSYRDHQAKKPIIYCYPTDTTELSVKLTFTAGGRFTYTYPTYPDSGWNVTAFPDGKLMDKQGKSYYSLFWEGEHRSVPDDSTGFVVHRDSLNSFFERSLDSLGLNYREKQEFIVYWSPKLKDNEFTFIHFSRKNYANSVKMEIMPKPATINRFLMLYRKSSAEEKPVPQRLENPGRTGFTVVEWGGAKLTEGVGEIK